MVCIAPRGDVVEVEQRQVVGPWWSGAHVFRTAAEPMELRNTKTTGAARGTQSFRVPFSGYILVLGVYMADSLGILFKLQGEQLGRSGCWC